MNEIPEGYIDKEEHYQQEGFKDYTDYAKYVYSSDDIIINDIDYKEVVSTDIEEVKRYFDDIYHWMEIDNRLDEFDFDTNCIDAGDYVRIIDKSEKNNTNYSVYFFDIDTLTLYYVHNNN
jgi:hypothetical protein